MRQKTPPTLPASPALRQRLAALVRRGDVGELRAEDEAAACLFHLAALVLDGSLAQQAGALARWHDDACEVDWDAVVEDDCQEEESAA